MKTTITRPEQAWAMLTTLGIETVEKLKALPPDELKAAAKLLQWLAEDAMKPKNSPGRGTTE